MRAIFDKWWRARLASVVSWLLSSCWGHYLLENKTCDVIIININMPVKSHSNRTFCCFLFFKHNHRCDFYSASFCVCDWWHMCVVCCCFGVWIYLRNTCLKGCMTACTEIIHKTWSTADWEFNSPFSSRWKQGSALLWKKNWWCDLLNKNFNKNILKRENKWKEKILLHFVKWIWD